MDEHWPFRRKPEIMLDMKLVGIIW